MRSPWNRCLAAVLVAAFGLVAGCATDPAPRKTAATDPPKKTTPDDSLSQQARQFRSTSGGDSGTGLSDKSREIEKDLGFQ